jgi:hypothetical protein
LEESRRWKDPDEHLTDQEAHKGDRQHKILTYSKGREYYNTNIQFSNHFRFVIHVPPNTAARSTEGIVIMMYHKWLHPRTNADGMVLCRPGDAAWTMVSNPTSKGRNFVDFASKLFAMTNRSATLVFDAWTQDVLYQVNVPPAMSNFSSKLLYGGGARVWDELQKQCLHFVALPHKLILAGFSWANLRHAGQLISISSS